MSFHPMAKTALALALLGAGVYWLARPDSAAPSASSPADAKSWSANPISSVEATQPHGLAVASLSRVASMSIEASGAPAVGTPAPASSSKKNPREIDWLDLMPPEDIEALKNLPAIDHTGMISADQFMSFNTVDKFDNFDGRIAGYIVPLDTDEDGKMTEFFLVPYFGACIHVPPPPPNQIILGRLETPIPMTDLYSPYWIEGTMLIDRTDNELGASAYTMRVKNVSLWEDESG